MGFLLIQFLEYTASGIDFVASSHPAVPKKSTPNQRFCWVIEGRFFGSIYGFPVDSIPRVHRQWH
jgi:hypothetical protein